MTDLPALRAQGFGDALIQYCNDLHEAGLFGDPAAAETKPVTGFEGNTITIDLQPRQQFGVAIGHAMRLTVFDDHATLQSRDTYLNESDQLAFVGMPMSFLPDSKTNTYSPDQYKQMALLIRGKADEHRAWAEDPIIDEYKIAAALTRFAMAAADKNITNLPVTTTDIFSQAVNAGQIENLRRNSEIKRFEAMEEEYRRLIGPYIECFDFCENDGMPSSTKRDFFVTNEYTHKSVFHSESDSKALSAVKIKPDSEQYTVPMLSTPQQYSSEISGGYYTAYHVNFIGNCVAIEMGTTLFARRAGLEKDSRLFVLTAEGCDRMMAKTVARLYANGAQHAQKAELCARDISARMHATPLPEYKTHAELKALSTRPSLLRRLFS